MQLVARRLLENAGAMIVAHLRVPAFVLAVQTCASSVPTGASEAEGPHEVSSQRSISQPRL